MLNQYAVDNPTLASNSVFPTSSSPWWNAEPFYRNAEPQRWSAKHLGHAWKIGKRFLQVQLCLLQHLIRRNWIIGSLTCQNTHHHMWWVKAKHQFKIRDRQPEIQSSLVKEVWKHFGADQQRLQISDPHFDKFATPATLTCWKIRFKTEVCTCSQFLAKAILWIKEVELVDSVNDLKCSCFCKRNSNAEFWRTRFEDCLSNTQFKRKVSLDFAEDGSLTWSTSTSGLLEPMILSKLCWLIHICFSKWWSSGIRFEMGQFSIINDENPSDDILEALYKLRIRESQKLNTVLELYDLETHQKKLGPDYHILKTMLQKVSSRVYEWRFFQPRNGIYEKNAVVKNQGTKQRWQKILGFCWQWEFNG